jgi:hypothetical protein
MRKALQLDDGGALRDDAVAMSLVEKMSRWDFDETPKSLSPQHSPPLESYEDVADEGDE